jgi:hypothetical protein
MHFLELLYVKNTLVFFPNFIASKFGQAILSLYSDRISGFKRSTNHYLDSTNSALWTGYLLYIQETLCQYSDIFNEDALAAFLRMAVKEALIKFARFNAKQFPSMAQLNPGSLPYKRLVQAPAVSACTKCSKFSMASKLQGQLNKCFHNMLIFIESLATKYLNNEL